MQKKNKSLRRVCVLLFSIGACLPLIALSQKLSVADYAFEKNIILEERSSDIFSVPLDRESLRHINDRFSNFNIFNENNEELDFSVFYKNPGIIKNVRLLKVSSERQGRPDAIVDEDFTTSFLFSEKIDRKDDSWFIVDLGRSKPLNRLELFVSENSRIREIELLGGNRLDTMETIYDKKAFQRSIELSQSPQVRYIAVSLWGLRIEIQDLRLTSSKEATIYLQGNEDRRFKVLYGGSEANHIKYKERYATPLITKVVGQLSKERWNSAFPEDIDGDEKINTEDNCPFISNSNQADKDEDRVGDVCDNAPKVKNQNQNDTDEDGVGDIIDNCKLIQNEDQADRDSDGFGDACDNAHAENDMFQKNMLLGIFGFLLVVFVLGTIWNISSKNKTS